MALQLKNTLVQYKTIGVLTGYWLWTLLNPWGAEAVAKSTASSNVRVHQIQSGETLYDLTQLYQVDAAAIATSNGISAATPLAVDSQLIIPPVDSIIHKVQPNDTLSQLASLYQVSQDEIAKASGLLSPDNLKVEQPLVIPGDIKHLLSHREAATIQSLAPQRDLLRQKLQGTDLTEASRPNPPLLTSESWSSRFHFQTDEIPNELAILTRSEARMTTVELFQLTREVTILDSWLNQQQPVASMSMQADSPDPIPLNIPIVRSPAMILPTQGAISSGFGWRWDRLHKGIDIAAPIGTPVWASAGGVIEFAGWDDSGYGNIIDIRHYDGFLTRYAHLSNIYAQQGDVVNQSQIVGAVGSTGNSTGPHLHFEIIPQSGVAVDPISYLIKR